MKNRIIAFFLVAVSLLTLVSCSKDKKLTKKDEENNDTYTLQSSGGGSLKSQKFDDNKDSDKEKKEQIDGDDKKIALEGKSKSKGKKDSNKKEFDKKVEDFYGKWEIKKVSAYANDNTSASSNAQSVVGKTIEFSKDKISYDGKEYKKPSYTTKKIIKDDFKKNYNKNLSDLKIHDGTCEELRIGNGNDIGIGNEYIWKNADSLVMIKDGNCYDLRKR